ncbi:SMI1/KNR4 family protein [Pyxidicoccus fallax]|uniref:SMI1/KNR4 family protein n=1 Tax=Pyxidicoccus fallax TaxID=394095 RepID=A0A848LJC1_9BACT|nr:SMI1/KNR4 family protein [Pyxidicoccus fallax]NMO17778.1 SMI1/KNR4 family protein [Pyxidicoccus fallax]NPC84255.1 SMI1/KNR4 family protein [Pyxidicoccus fallax]
MKLQFTHGKEPLTPERIQEVEAQLGRKLPDEYKRFLLKQHGGHPEPCEFEFVRQGEKDWAVIAYFLNLGDEHETLSEYLISYEDRIPRDTLPIARDPGGNPILLAVSGKNQGKVYFWMREYEPDDPDEVQEYDHLGFVANSLDEFLGALTKRP